MVFFSKIQHGPRLATSKLIGSFLTFTLAITSIWFTLDRRKTNPSDPYDYDALTTTSFDSHRVLTLLTTTITITTLVYVSR